MLEDLKFDYKGFLIPGIYTLKFEELNKAFGLSERREELISKLRFALINLKEAGIKKVYLDGSFITTKEFPNDIDGCWDWEDDADENKIDLVLLNMIDRKFMKEKYGVDFFLANIEEGGSGLPFIDFFQLTRDGERKGIILLELDKEDFY